MCVVPVHVRAQQGGHQPALPAAQRDLPERVFEAIAALTGLDAELEQEREARRDEHARRVRAAQAGDRLAEFEAESKALLTTFDRRDQARIRLADALRCWRGRQARRLADAAAKDESLATDLERHRAAGEKAAEAIAMVKAEITTLREDTLDRQVSQARKELVALQARAAKLDADRAVAENSADELRGQSQGLEETRRFADGRDVPTAERELREVRLRLNEALKALGVADQEAHWRRPRWTTRRAARRRPSSTRWRRRASARPACWTRWTWPSRRVRSRSRPGGAGGRTSTP